MLGDTNGTLEALETPVPLVDLDVMGGNLDAMLFGPGNALFNGETAAAAPTLFGRLTAAAMALARKPRRRVLRSGGQGQWKTDDAHDVRQQRDRADSTAMTQRRYAKRRHRIGPRKAGQTRHGLKVKEVPTERLSVLAQRTR